MRSIASSYACSELTGRIFMLHLRRIYFVIVFMPAKPFDKYNLAAEINSGY
jgi:hypothetical protein